MNEWWGLGVNTQAINENSIGITVKYGFMSELNALCECLITKTYSMKGFFCAVDGYINVYKLI